MGLRSETGSPKPPRWTTARPEVSWSSYGPAAVLGGLLGFICASPVVLALPARWGSILVVFVALILLGSGVGVAAALIAGRFIGSAGWLSYAVIFAAPLVVAMIPWWASPTGAPAAAVALLGGAFIGRFIVHRPVPAPAPPVRSPKSRSLDRSRSIIGLRLEDAMVDADGTVYGTGRLDFPPDAQDAFHPSTGSTVSMRATVDEALIFSACTFRRDEVTGYLIGQPVGPVLVVPEEASSVIRTVLRSASKAPLSFSVRTGGALIEGDRVQGLTEMFGSAQSFGEEDDDGGVVVIQLTASLRAGRKESNHWPASLTPEKVSLSFAISPITRVVRFGAHSRAIPAWSLEAHQSTPTELDSMRLATSLIGPVERAYGRADDASIVALHQHRYGRPSLTLELGFQEQRDASGLIATTNAYPRVRFRPVDLDDVAERIGADRRFAIELGESESESDPEGIQYTSGGPDGPGRSERITASRLDFEIARSGLLIDWIAHRDGDLPPMQGRVTVPWEVLIVRFPRFLRHRDSVLAP